MIMIIAEEILVIDFRWRDAAVYYVLPALGFQHWDPEPGNTYYHRTTIVPTR